jgi:hypothetical protein
VTTRRAVVVLVLVLAVALAGCGANDSHVANERADRLVRLAHTSDLAPNLTNEVARTLYGASGGRVCATLRDDESPTVIPLARTRALVEPDEHTRDLVRFDMLVVAVYCPGQRAALADLLDRLGYDG